MEGNPDLNVIDGGGNTVLHHAAQAAHMDLVKFCMDHGSNPAIRNSMGKTAYDVCKSDNIRQYLLPLQFKHEYPKAANANLPAGITPTLDPNAYKAPLAPPPAMMGVVYSSASPTSASRSGLNTNVFRPIQADGFGSSVGNAALTAKYGNTIDVKKTAPPPHEMKAQPTTQNVNAPTYSAGVNPYANGRYTTYDVHTNAPGAVLAPSVAKAPTVSRPKFTVFNPTQNVVQQSGGFNGSGSTGAPTPPGSFGAPSAGLNGASTFSGGAPLHSNTPAYSSVSTPPFNGPASDSNGSAPNSYGAAINSFGSAPNLNGLEPNSFGLATNSNGAAPYSNRAPPLNNSAPNSFGAEPNGAAPPSSPLKPFSNGPLVMSDAPAPSAVPQTAASAFESVPNDTLSERLETVNLSDDEDEGEPIDMSATASAVQ